VDKEPTTGSATTKPTTTKRVSFREDSDTAAGTLDTAIASQARQRLASVTEDDMWRYLPADGIPALDEPEAVDEFADGGDGSGSHVSSCCWACARLIKNKSRAMPKSFIQLSKGKSRMTSSEIMEDDRSMPTAHSIVANYARMLCDNRPQFVETMFRAVKLNKLDVTKILCKIIQVSANYFSWFNPS
jgi:hypothetical protein